MKDTPLENLPPEDPVRQHRLYQSSFLLRDYGFGLEEMPFDPQGNLPRDVDPKMAWAAATLAHTPVEINRANRQQLLRVPGIGPHGAALILKHRSKNKILSLRDLEKLGIKTKRIAPFVLLNGRKPEQQLVLF